ncbi:MAG: DUF624 domain-containing protein [Mycoplasmatales bacterium]
MTIVEHRKHKNLLNMTGELIIINTIFCILSLLSFMILTFPTLMAMIYYFNKVDRDQMNVDQRVKLFYKGFKNNLKNGFIIYLINFVLLTILLTNIFYINSNEIIKVINVIGLYELIIMNMYLLSITVMYDLKLKKCISYSLIIGNLNIGMTILMVILAIIYILVSVTSVILILIVVSSLTLLINKNVLKVCENYFVTEKEGKNVKI